MPSNATRFCVDCQHYKAADKSNPVAECQAPQSEISLVTGQPKYLPCIVQRGYSSASLLEKHCGAPGQWFVAKPNGG
jgi:hypothetical protein